MSDEPLGFCPLCQVKTHLAPSDHAQVRRHRWLFDHQRFLARGWVRGLMGARMMVGPFPHLIERGVINEGGSEGWYTPRWAAVIANQERMPLYRRRNLIRLVERDPTRLDALFIELLLGAPALEPLQQLRYLIANVRLDLEQLVKDTNWAGFVGFEVPPRKPNKPVYAYREEACAAEGKQQLRLLGVLDAG